MLQVPPLQNTVESPLNTRMNMNAQEVAQECGVCDGKCPACHGGQICEACQEQEQWQQQPAMMMEANTDPYGHVLKPDGSYIEPKDFIDQFSIHMHQNRQQAFQGMTKEEQIQAEECVAHFREEHMGQKMTPHLRRNAYENTANSLQIFAQVAEMEDQNALFDDVHDYGPI